MAAFQQINGTADNNHNGNMKLEKMQYALQYSWQLMYTVVTVCKS